jgi:hypothetical protein
MSRLVAESTLKKLSVALALAAPLAIFAIPAAKADVFWGGPGPAWSHPVPAPRVWAPPPWQRSFRPYATPSWRTHFVPRSWRYDNGRRSWVAPRRW